jgi:YesN/AraC family two-component response regulator
VEEIIDLKPAGYLLKPPDKDKLIEMIEKVLERQLRKLAMKKEEEERDDD